MSYTEALRARLAAVNTPPSALVTPPSALVTPHTEALRARLAAANTPPSTLVTAPSALVTPPAPEPTPPSPEPTPPPRKPLRKRTWFRVTGAASVAVVALIIGVNAAGSHPAKAAPAPSTSAPKATHSASAKPGHRPAASRAAASAVPAGYATDILNAGITAPVSWINATGQKIVADWRAGDTAAWTDANVLTPDGVYASHLATFDQITARDFGVTPPAQGAQSAAPAPSASQPAAPAPSASQPAAPAAPAGPTVSQQQALNDAQNYLGMDSGFSRDGLIGQLEFDKFSAADATWAVDHSGADWYQQAVYSAKGYMQMGGFSRGSLIDQLQFDKYTYGQASYAASQVGL